MDMNKRYNILVVDDEVEYLNVFEIILSENGYNVISTQNSTEALSIIKDREIHLVLTDLKMPGMGGQELIKNIKKYDDDIDIIVITAFGTIESAVQALKNGASGYFVKSNDLETLLIDIDKIMKIKKLSISNDILRKQTLPEEIFIQTKNNSFQSLIDICRKTADTDINVLLLGESGVGKEVFANYIHSISNRKDNHFIAVNCQVFSESMIESELFGHEKGSFTGASDKRIGRFEEANYGTLFLDEIGDLSPNIQIKLLRALENRKIERIGSNKSIELDIRLISATNKDINSEVFSGSFRKDLLYRVNALTITIPPLRERKEDLPDLIEFFLKKINTDQKKSIYEIEGSAMDFLLKYDYPGNVRELKNILERLVALSENGRISDKYINFPIRNQPFTQDASKTENRTLRNARADFETRYIRNILKEKNGNMNEVADLLGITKRQLANKIIEYDLKSFIRKFISIIKIIHFTNA